MLSLSPACVLSLQTAGTLLTAVRCPVSLRFGGRKEGGEGGREGRRGRTDDETVGGEERGGGGEGEEGEGGEGDDADGEDDAVDAVGNADHCRGGVEEGGGRDGGSRESEIAWPREDRGALPFDSLLGLSQGARCCRV